MKGHTPAPDTLDLVHGLWTTPHGWNGAWLTRSSICSTNLPNAERRSVGC